ncbi:MAG: chorismate mutase [Actinomycetota bacterium]|nr:chorismate mutase [Actinomycetota bacterium]
MALRALRGATTVEEDTRAQVAERVQALIGEMLSRNGVTHDDIISMIFTATADIVSMFPASAARAAGLGDVPLLCAQELSVVGSTPHCIRILIHFATERSRAELIHVYLEGAEALRDDLPG